MLLTAFIVSFLTPMSPAPAFASEPDWSEGVPVSTPRNNPYALSDTDWKTSKAAGYRHTLEYPVYVSGMLMPWRPVKTFLDDDSPNPIRAILQKLFEGVSRVHTTDDLFARLGLNEYPKLKEDGSSDIPLPNPKYPNVRMGVTILRKNGVEALTISCAACHTSNLFGKKILGMTNRFPHANEFFVNGKKGFAVISPSLLQQTLGATSEETDLYARLRERTRAIGVKAPSTDGLDTSLAQVALSLAHRSDDEYASFNRMGEILPREEKLSKLVADSKPAVWWNLKYKNRWLSDGSVVSGNPIYTNFLWNEIGRGTDLHELQTWLDENPKVIEELTTAVFSTEAPRYTDFFPADRITITRAKHGQELFEKTCSVCHGSYVKNWEQPNSEILPLSEQLQTAEVRYPEVTKVKDVGTDPNRWMGMSSLENGLNPLAISKRNGIVIRSQKGYVPPPLVGIWARFPYLHNNSVPNLCSLLTPGSARPSKYYSGEANDREKDFDSDCVGYPLGEKTPAGWKTNADRLYDTSRDGMSNRGHDDRIFVKDGVEILTATDKRDLIEFLKTL